jgi:hypothetical protein
MMGSGNPRQAALFEFSEGTHRCTGMIIVCCGILLRNFGEYCPLLPEKVVATLVQCKLLVSGKKNCQSCLKRVVSTHLIGWLFVGKSLFQGARTIKIEGRFTNIPA